jgi:hypothetical protein
MDTISKTLSRVTIIDNVLDDTLDEVYEHVENVADFLFSYFDLWPSTAKIYKDVVSPENEIPLESPNDVELLEKFVGHLIVVIYPSGIGPGGVLGLVLGIGASWLVKKRPKKKEQTDPYEELKKRYGKKAPNNKITARSNSDRVRERIPDIYGEVVSIPDAISKPVIVWEDGQYYEYAFYCIGRGEYSINATDVKEGDIVIPTTGANTVEIYGPNQTPGVSTPQLRIGPAITKPYLVSYSDPDFEGPIELLASPDIEIETEGVGEFAFVFELSYAGEEIQSTYAWLDLRIQRLNSNGTNLGAETQRYHYFGDGNGSNFRVSVPHVGKIRFTLKRYTIGSTATIKLIDFRIYEVNESQNFGNVTTVYTRTLIPQEIDFDERIQSVSTDPVVIEALNNHKSILAAKAQIERQQKTEDQQRKLNIKVTRKVPIINSNNTIGAIAPSKKFSDILYAISIDPFLGNLDPSSIDVNNLRTTYNAVVSYFGNAKAAEFCYTFDDANTSFEEMFSTIAEAGFCIGYRRGSVLRVHFEKEQINSSILFNHRNKLPNSEVRTAIFGTRSGYDGVEVEYQNLNVKMSGDSDGTKLYFPIPYDESAAKPDKLRIDGVQNKLQAYFHAHRLFNRLIFQKMAIEFDATSEAMLLLPGERILVADNTRTGTMDGEVESRVGAVLTLSQGVALDIAKSYTIFLQNADGTIITKPVTQGDAVNKVVLGSTSGLILALDDDLYARTTFEIVEGDSPRLQAFLVEEKEPSDNFVTTVRAVNYDARYYANDKDLINGIIDANGELT